MLNVLVILELLGYFFQFVSVWLISAVVLKMTFEEYAKKTFTYSYEVYGMFWGTSTTAFVILGLNYGAYTYIGVDYIQSANINEATSQLAIFFVVFLIVIIPVAELPVAIYAARKGKAAVAVPCIIRYPVTVLCCRKKKLAKQIITAIALWADLVALQLVLFLGIFMLRCLPAAPFAIATNVMLFVLALTCIINFFSLLFTILANLFTPTPDQQQEPGQEHSSSIVLQAVVVLPVLLMIMCYGGFIAYTELLTNIDTRSKNNPFSFIISIISPLLLAVITIFLNKLISAWLQWSPQGNENETNTSQVQEGGEHTSETHDDINADEALCDLGLKLIPLDPRPIAIHQQY